MRVCPKCQRKVAADSKICRVCGLIFDVVENVALPQKFAAEEVASEASLAQEESVVKSDQEVGTTGAQLTDSLPWKCPNCHEEVEHNFDICWRCGTDREGISDPEFAADWDENSQAIADEQSSEFDQRVRSCIRCGSGRVIPCATIHDQGQHSDGKLYALILGNPDALLFRDRMYGEIRADICGSCGHAELRVQNPEELYQHYLRSLE